jgi:hypothetical protein
MNKRILTAALGATLVASVLASAQHEHFQDFKWRERQSDHFTLRASSTNHDPARKYAEKVWDECVRIMPGLEDDFTKNEFRTPGGAKGADTAPYRFTVYLVGTGHDYDKILEQQQNRSGWNANTLRACRMTRNYGDPQNRYTVYCKADPENTGGGGETDLTPAFVHGTATTILEGRGLTNNMPFWFTAGWGYYVEHRIFRLCRVHYVDFENYYKNNANAEIKRGGVLGPQDAWTNPLRKMCKKGIRETLDRISKAKILTITPNESGYMFALTYFLVSTDERIENYRKLIAKSRDGQAVTKELLLEIYGYEDDAALEEDWYEFMESRDFR